MNGSYPDKYKNLTKGKTSRHMKIGAKLCEKSHRLFYNIKNCSPELAEKIEKEIREAEKMDAKEILSLLQKHNISLRALANELEVAPYMLVSPNKRLEVTLYYFYIYEFIFKKYIFEFLKKLDPEKCRCVEADSPVTYFF